MVCLFDDRWKILGNIQSKVEGDSFEDEGYEHEWFQVSLGPNPEVPFVFGVCGNKRFLQNVTTAFKTTCGQTCCFVFCLVMEVVWEFLIITLRVY